MLRAEPMTAEAAEGGGLCAPAADERLSFPAFYERWFDDVVRWVRALGAPARDVEDVAQNAFLVVRRKLEGFDGRNPEGWLFRIAARQVKDHARRAWFKHLFSRQQDELPLELTDLSEPGLDPGALLERAEARRIVHGVLAQMTEKQRVVFALYELEGLEGQRIAELLGIPLATVWTRLFHARREFQARARALDSEEAGATSAAAKSEAP